MTNLRQITCRPILGLSLVKVNTEMCSFYSLMCAIFFLVCLLFTTFCVKELERPQEVCFSPEELRETQK